MQMTMANGQEIADNIFNLRVRVIQANKLPCQIYPIIICWAFAFQRKAVKILKISNEEQNTKYF